MVVIEENSIKTVARFYEKTAIILINYNSPQSAPRSKGEDKIEDVCNWPAKTLHAFDLRQENAALTTPRPCVHNGQVLDNKIVGLSSCTKF